MRMHVVVAGRIGSTVQRGQPELHSLTHMQPNGMTATLGYQTRPAGRFWRAARSRRRTTYTLFFWIVFSSRACPHDTRCEQYLPTHSTRVPMWRTLRFVTHSCYQRRYGTTSAPWVSSHAPYELRHRDVMLSREFLQRLPWLELHRRTSTDRLRCSAACKAGASRRVRA